MAVVFRLRTILRHCTLKSQMCSANRIRQTSYFSKENIKVSDDLASAEVILPGLAVGNVERAGNFASALQITRLVEAASVMPYFPKGSEIGSFGDIWSLEQEYNDFTKCAWHSTKPAFYTSPIHWSEMTVTMQLDFIGRTSFQFRVAVTDGVEELMVSKTFLVCVDKVTHKPTPLPEWWLKQFKPKIPVNSKPHVVQPFEKLSDVPVYCYQMKAHYCDVDLFGHVNNANYLKYCLEAASDAVKNKFYSKVLKNVYRCHMQDMEQLYIGQCHAGDTIAMETWENPSDPYTLYFMMFNNGTCIYQCTLKLYP